MTRNMENDKEVVFNKIQDNMVVVKFDERAKLDKVLEEGPWSFQNQMVMLRRWEIGRKPQDLDFSNVQLWVQLHNISVELMNNQIVKGVAEIILDGAEDLGPTEELMARLITTKDGATQGINEVQAPQGENRTEISPDEGSRFGGTVVTIDSERPSEPLRMEVEPYIGGMWGDERASSQLEVSRDERDRSGRMCTRE
ncbi:hypothetical protein QQ045_027247 [Rhodiola kirilowii]